MAKHITGIDLGTTNSAAAILNELGKPEIVPNTDGERITPSLILFEEDRVSIGGEAKDAAGRYPEDRRVEEIKREMHNLAYRQIIDGKEYSPADLSSLILKKTVSGVVEHKGGVGPVAISVPADFKEDGRKATLEAGRLAGLDVIHIVNEPTAAAIAYATEHALNGCYLVFDLGGGTFDVTILEARGRDIKIITSQGNADLGGCDFDRELLKIFEEEYRTKTGEELCAAENSEDEDARYKLKQEAEKVKRALSKKGKYPVLLENRAGGEKIRLDFPRARFEEAISTDIAQTELLVEKAMDDANLKPDAIDEILLVGGSTRIPAVAASVERMFGKKPVTGINPDEAVAMGAAISAGLAAMHKRPKSVSASARRELEKGGVTDVVNHSYGAIVRDQMTGRLENAIIIKKDSRLPATGKRDFETGYDNQDIATSAVVQGEDLDPEFLPKPLYDVKIPLPPGCPAGRKINVVYTCDENHVLHCRFEDMEGGGSDEVRLNLKGERDDDDGDARKRELDDLTIE